MSDKQYTVTGRGTNDQGNSYDNRSYSDGPAYHYSNQNGSYYYSNSNGSTYYNSGTGYAQYNSPSGNQTQYYSGSSGQSGNGGNTK